MKELWLEKYGSGKKRIKFVVDTVLVAENEAAFNNMLKYLIKSWRNME